MSHLRSQLLKRQIAKYGKPAVLTRYTDNGQDSYGDTQYTKQTDNLTVIISTATNTRMPFIRMGELGHYYMMQVEFFALDTIIPVNTAVDKPSTLLHEGLTYEITEIEPAEPIGAIRLIGYRERQ